MNVEIQVNNSTSSSARFLSWAPSPCRIRVTNPAGATTPTAHVDLASVGSAGGGAVTFRAGTTGNFGTTLRLQLPVNGVSVPFFAAGQFGKPSVNLNDVSIEARAGGSVAGSVAVTVRIRKDATTLTAGERDRFIAAMAQLNDQGRGRFADFRNMHDELALSQAHGAPAFLPWHRAYLLDLERELQNIDASVALPYWRFDRPAPTIFTREFLGVADSVGTVQFSPSNPLQFWRTDNLPGINRRPRFNTSQAPPGLRNEAATLALGTQFLNFRTMEGNPHGLAHTSFGGLVSDPATAPRDPLFFLLHCYVDRLWANWQRQNSRFDTNVAAAFDEQPTSPPGHRLADTMWPWNGVTGGSRPPTAPGGTLATSATAGAPGLQPRVRDLLDYLGVVNPAARMGFSYDDVRF